MDTFDKHFNRRKFEEARRADYGDGKGGCDEGIKTCNKEMEGIYFPHDDEQADRLAHQKYLQAVIPYLNGGSPPLFRRRSYLYSPQ